MPSVTMGEATWSDIDHRNSIARAVDSSSPYGVRSMMATTPSPHATNATMAQNPSGMRHRFAASASLLLIVRLPFLVFRKSSGSLLRIAASAKPRPQNCSDENTPVAGLQRSDGLLTGEQLMPLLSS